MAMVLGFSGGDGSQNDPYEISSCSHINDIRNNLSSNYSIVNDIDCSGVNITQIGDETRPFKGNLYGNDYTISNLTFNSSSASESIFYAMNNATITDLTIKNAYINTTKDASFISIKVENRSLINNTHITGEINGDLASCITIALHHSKINNSHCDINLTFQNRFTGGLVSEVHGNQSNDANVGIIDRSYTTGMLNSTATSECSWIGGIASHVVFQGTIQNSYSNMTILQKTGVSGCDVGGIAGILGWDNGYNNIVKNTYFSGFINYTAGQEYGIVGNKNTGTILNYSYWDKTRNPHINSSNGGVNKTTEEMMQQSTYENWDFNNIWAIREGGTYPFLQTTKNITFYDDFEAYENNSIIDYMVHFISSNEIGPKDLCYVNRVHNDSYYRCVDNSSNMLNSFINVSGSDSWTNYTVETKFRINETYSPENGSGVSAGLAEEYNDAGDYDYMEFNNAYLLHGLGRYGNTIYEEENTEVIPGKWYKIKLLFRANYSKNYTDAIYPDLMIEYKAKLWLANNTEPSNWSTYAVQPDWANYTTPYGSAGLSTVNTKVDYDYINVTGDVTLNPNSNYSGDNQTNDSNSIDDGGSGGGSGGAWPEPTSTTEENNTSTVTTQTEDDTSFSIIDMQKIQSNWWLLLLLIALVAVLWYMSQHDKKKKPKTKKKKSRRR